MSDEMASHSVLGRKSMRRARSRSVRTFSVGYLASRLAMRTRLAVPSRRAFMPAAAVCSR